MTATEDEGDFLDFTPIPAVESPCVNICRMTGGLCDGCGRTLDEIAEWSTATDERRREILARIEQTSGG